ncbi:hypothetical protein HN51_039041 [Arachis hypogaea]
MMYGTRIVVNGLIQVGAEGSKILVTTRSYAIASMMDSIYSHNLKGLPLEDLFSVFCKWAFTDRETQHPDLLAIGMEIVKKRGGAPLAARTMGTLLFQKFE